MNLSALIDRYAIEHDVKSATVDFYRTCARLLERLLDKPPVVDDLTPSNVNQLILWLKEHGRKKHTIQSRRQGLLVLARYARRLDLIEFDQDRVVRVRCPETKKDIWTVRDVLHILSTINGLDEYRIPVSQISRRKYWTGIVLCAWDTALRHSDLAELRLCDVESNAIEIIQMKTGVGHRGMIRPETLDAIRATFEGPASNREKIWPYHRREWFYDDFRRIMKAAKLSGTFKKLRRSSITNAEQNMPGSGFLHAGHTNPTTTHRWYIPRDSLVRDRLLTSVLENGIGKETEPSFRESNAS